MQMNERPILQNIYIGGAHPNLLSQSDSAINTFSRQEAPPDYYAPDQTRIYQNVTIATQTSNDISTQTEIGKPSSSKSVSPLPDWLEEDPDPIPQHSTALVFTDDGIKEQNNEPKQIIIVYDEDTTYSERSSSENVPIEEIWVENNPVLYTEIEEVPKEHEYEEAIIIEPPVPEGLRADWKANSVYHKKDGTIPRQYPLSPQFFVLEDIDSDRGKCCCSFECCCPVRFQKLWRSYQNRSCKWHKDHDVSKLLKV